MDDRVEIGVQDARIDRARAIDHFGVAGGEVRPDIRNQLPVDQDVSFLEVAQSRAEAEHDAPTQQNAASPAVPMRSWGSPRAQRAPASCAGAKEAPPSPAAVAVRNSRRDGGLWAAASVPASEVSVVRPVGGSGHEGFVDTSASTTKRIEHLLLRPDESCRAGLVKDKFAKQNMK